MSRGPTADQRQAGDGGLRSMHHRGAYLVVVDGCVSLGGGDGRVAEQSLDGAQVPAAAVGACGESVAQGVGGPGAGHGVGAEFADASG